MGNDDTPSKDIISKQNNPAYDVTHEDKVSSSGEGSLPELMGSLAIRSGNTSYSPPVNAPHPPEITKGNEGETLSSLTDTKLDHDGIEQNSQPEQSDDECSEIGSAEEDIKNDEYDDGDDYDSDYDDDDISIDDDPFLTLRTPRIIRQRSKWTLSERPWKKTRRLPRRPTKKP